LIILPISFTALLFAPKIGQKLIGIVNQVGADHIGLLVLGIFNASIPLQNIRKEFIRQEDTEKWQSTRNIESSIEVGVVILFDIINFEVSHDIISFVGSIMDAESTGPVGYSKVPPRTPPQLSAAPTRTAAAASPTTDEPVTTNAKKQKTKK